MAETLGDRIQMAACCITLGELEFQVGEATDAIAHALKAAEIFSSVRDSASAGQAYANAAAYLIVLGDVQRARSCAIDALVGSRDARWSVIIAVAIQQLATTMAFLGDARRAAMLCGYVDKWYREVGYKRDFTEQKTYELLVTALHNELADDEVRKLTLAGSELSEAQAIIEALR